MRIPKHLELLESIPLHIKTDDEMLADDYSQDWLSKQIDCNINDLIGIDIAYTNEEINNNSEIYAIKLDNNRKTMIRITPNELIMFSSNFDIAMMLKYITLNNKPITLHLIDRDLDNDEVELKNNSQGLFRLKIRHKGLKVNMNLSKGNTSNENYTNR